MRVQFIEKRAAVVVDFFHCPTFCPVVRAVSNANDVGMIIHVLVDKTGIERRAADAERDVDDLYKTMFMSERIGREYNAVISGVTSFGLFAELPNTIEGFIPIESLFGTYTFDEQKLRLNGTERSYAIGEEIRVKVIDVDFYRRRTEFRLLEKIEKRG